MSAVLGLSVLSLVACQPVQTATPAAATSEATAEVTAEATAEVTAEVTTEAATDEATVTVNLSAAGIDMPAEIPSGIVTFVYELAADAPGLPEFARLNDGVTVDQVMEAMQADPMAALALVTQIGNSDTTVDSRVTYELQAGEYVGLLFPENGAPLTTTFIAGAPSGAVAPEAAVTAQLADFAFILPDEIAAGPQTWLVENTGAQWHEMLVIKPQEGVSVDDLLATLAAEEQSGPPPFEWVAGVWPIGAGQRAWVTWDLAPGEYTVICFLPDMAGDMAPHAAHGMVRTLIVK
jgi:hypothetical protein